MNRLTRDGTAEPVLRDQILRHARGQRNIHFPCSADHEQDWQTYPVDPYSAICDDPTYIDYNPKKTTVLNTVANPARGLLNTEKGTCTKEKVWQRAPPTLLVINILISI